MLLLSGCAVFTTGRHEIYFAWQGRRCENEGHRASQDPQQVQDQFSVTAEHAELEQMIELSELKAEPVTQLDSLLESDAQLDLRRRGLRERASGERRDLLTWGRP